MTEPWTAMPDEPLRGGTEDDGLQDTMTSCPECGTTSVVRPSRRDAEDFCPACDYPLFWARSYPAATAPAGDSDDARRRAPGASGATLIATVPCPSCFELNLPGAWLCIRCDGSMTPPPPPVPAPVLMPVLVPDPVTVREPTPAERFPWWWFVAMVVAVGGFWAVSTFL
ncbi:hypothetical protein [Actinotalea sp. K2]|uniref:hypothetical protein n=1 Tax=Actinotalea sp. K2 TaxID=2939438 RepID=UPI00201822A9|nr:hypothetical protein [Actinotalea sp. K2]MCL3861862.1 hypothetical protein [Actinotalea sp. K2]